MSENGVRRTPTLETEWEDMTDRHRDRRERGEANIAEFSQAGSNASYVVGAIGAGKTQLLTHLYKYSYREIGQPALFLSLGELLDSVATHIEYPQEIQNISQEQFHTEVETLVKRELDRIHKRILEDEELTRDLLLLDSGRITGVKEYADQLGLTVEEFADITSQTEEVTLIVDEMEESYDRLEEMIRSTTGPLRDTVDKVQSGKSRFYLIGGFGYASVHEIGEAEYRRVDTLVLPIIKPDNIEEVFGENLPVTERNFIWWMSRGRPGWLETARNAYRSHTGNVDGSYATLGEIPGTTMSRVSILSIEDLEVYCGDIGHDARDLTAYSIFTPAPTQLETFGNDDWIDRLSGMSPKVMLAEELTDIEAVTRAFLNGVESHDSYEEYDVSDQVIRRYVNRFLQSIANGGGQIVFGDASTVTFQQGKVCKDRMLSPLAERVHDLALEEAGEEHQETIDFLYELAQYVDNSDESSLSREFGDFLELFSEQSEENLSVDGYLGPAMGSLVAVFPSLITNPRLTFAGTARTESEQFSELVKLLSSMGNPGARLSEFGDIMSEDPR
ncbi:hypothetical protein SAMN05216559_1853 [Halomicrobium zhouii]|uniref:Uncharacterized protein n=1 Tax=Halomicrobium zhouii TaxID=767519 RepID=A0A1I6L1W3_9EURY|nr:hypothetical protein [Halomicrobium zhouii]SFR97436.1 hypothetical protein SAMN05216559_1853 [Halomicrobium zhouii]